MSTNIFFEFTLKMSKLSSSLFTLHSLGPGTCRDLWIIIYRPQTTAISTESRKILIPLCRNIMGHIQKDALRISSVIKSTEQ